MKITSLNPSTNEVIKEFESSTFQEVHQAVDKAKKAGEKWSELSLDERMTYFQKLSEVLQKNMKDILSVMKEEAGRRIPDAEAEFYDVVDAIQYYFDQAKKVPHNIQIPINTQVFTNTTLQIDYVPYGVIGLIMPWNFPFYTPMMYVIASLMSGNAVVMKPSEYTTLIGLEMKKQFQEAGFSEGLFEIVIGAEETGRALVKSSVGKIFFVGSVAVGEDILADAGIKPVQIESGGNSAALVLEDADIDLAVKAVTWAGTYASGQDCVGIKRVFVAEKIADKFLQKLVQAVKELRAGIDYGPYIREDALEVVKKRIEDAVSKGAKLLVGGEKIEANGEKGFWLSPSVLTYTDEALELVTQETFGNTIPVMIVKDENEAVEKANRTTYGLSNAIFTKDLEKAKQLAEKLESGMVFINDPFIAIPGWDHWTGWKNSGFGTTESKLMQCLRKKVISVNEKGEARSFWYPYPEEQKG